MNKSQPYISPLTKDEIKEVARNMGIEECFFHGGKSQLIQNILTHFDTMRIFNVIIGTDEAKNRAEEYKQECKIFMEMCDITEISPSYESNLHSIQDGVSPELSPAALLVA